MGWPRELSSGGRFALELASRLVPRRRRDAWRREWEAELSVVLERARKEPLRRMIGAAFRDALWLRMHSEPANPVEWRRERRRRDDVLLQTGLDLRLAFRRLARSPRYALLVTSVLGIGIGATVAVATLVEAVLLRPLPYAEGARVVRALAFDPKEQKLDWVSWAQVQTWREAESFDRVAAATTFPAILKRDAGSTRLQRAFVSPGYFDLLGVRPRLGADLELRDGTVVVSHRLWRQEWASRPDVLGQGMNLDGRVYEIQAVAPEALYDHDLGGATADVWIAQPLEETVSDPDFRIFTFFGRLKPGVDRLSAEREISRLQANLAASAPETYEGWDVKVEELRESMVGHLRSSLVLLFGAVVLVLLIVATNLSNLVLSRTLARRRELAVHVALGARTGALVRSLAVENLILALAGGVLGMAVSRAGLRLATSFAEWPLPRLEELFEAPPPWAFSIAIAVGIAFVFGTAPALLAARRELAPSLAGSRSTTARSRWRGLVIGTQVALSVPLVMGAVLLTQSFLELERRSFGRSPDGLLSLRVSLPREWIGALDPSSLTRVARFFDETMSEIRALPEVERVGGSVYAPFLGDADRARFQIVGDPIPDPAESPRALLLLATPEYFETLGIPIVSGRPFDGRDDDRSTPVAIVNAELARRMFPGRSPLGRSLQTEWSFTPSAPNALTARTIVGVVEDIAQLGPIEPVEPQIYVPHAQAPFPSLAFVVRTTGSPDALGRAIETLVREREPLAIVEERIALRDALHQTLGRPRFYAQIVGLFGITAAALFALGLYGLLSYRVATQHRELGVRAALGASPGRLLASILKSALRVSGAGFLAGALGALVLARLLESYVPGVSVFDPVTLLATPLLVLATALAASWLPARRAARTEIVEALRLDE